MIAKYIFPVIAFFFCAISTAATQTDTDALEWGNRPVIVKYRSGDSVITVLGRLNKMDEKHVILDLPDGKGKKRLAFMDVVTIELASPKSRVNMIAFIGGVLVEVNETLKKKKRNPENLDKLLKQHRKNLTRAKTRKECLKAVIWIYALSHTGEASPMRGIQPRAHADDGRDDQGEASPMRGIQLLKELEKKYNSETMARLKKLMGSIPQDIYAESLSEAAKLHHPKKKRDAPKHPR